MVGKTVCAVFPPVLGHLLLDLFPPSGVGVVPSNGPFPTVNKIKSIFDGSQKHFVFWFVPNLCWQVVAGHYNLLWPDTELSRALSLSLEGVLVCPLFQKVSEASMTEVIVV